VFALESDKPSGISGKYMGVCHTSWACGIADPTVLHGFLKATTSQTWHTVLEEKGPVRVPRPRKSAGSNLDTRQKAESSTSASQAASETKKAGTTSPNADLSGADLADRQEAGGSPVTEKADGSNGDGKGKGSNGNLPANAQANLEKVCLILLLVCKLACHGLVHRHGKHRLWQIATRI